MRGICVNLYDEHGLSMYEGAVRRAEEKRGRVRGNEFFFSSSVCSPISSKWLKSNCTRHLCPPLMTDHFTTLLRPTTFNNISFSGGRYTI